MTDQLHLPAIEAQATTITLPGSKSISNRSLLLAALADNRCHIHSLLQSDDTQRMLDALNTLGIHLEQQGNELIIEGNHGNFPNHQAELFLGNAGTAFRPLTATLAILGGNYTLSGIPRMHERPIGDLVAALKQTGAQINYLGEEGYPPLRIHPRQDNGKRHIQIKGNVSSQFLTALLIALPLTQEAYTIEVVGELISKPYIDITLKLITQFGINITHEQHQIFHIPAKAHYHAPEHLYIEGDASSASYFLAAGLITGKPITVTGIGKHAIQGDVAFAEELEKIGAKVEWGENQIEISRPTHQPIQAFDLDANHIPDAAMTLAIIALAANGTSHIRNIASWRVKETDRIAAMATELRKLGATVEETADSISITPPPKLIANAQIDTYDDHRMAMCFSLVALMNTPISINDPQCVNKTFPHYFEVFQTLAKTS